jgi:hypothetical protein
LFRDVTTTSAEREEEEEEEGREEREEREEEEKEKPVAAEASNTSSIVAVGVSLVRTPLAGLAESQPAGAPPAKKSTLTSKGVSCPRFKDGGSESTSLSLETPRCFCFSPPSSSAPAGAASNRIAGGREEGETTSAGRGGGGDCRRRLAVFASAAAADAAAEGAASPLPPHLRTPFAALDTSLSCNSAGVAPGHASMNTAAAPETTGAAIEVPEATAVFVAEGAFLHSPSPSSPPSMPLRTLVAEVKLTPGACRSTQGP